MVKTTNLILLFFALSAPNITVFQSNHLIIFCNKKRENELEMDNTSITIREDEKLRIII